MTVEQVTWISDLDPENPRPGDSISAGDDHIRNIKKSIKSTFPNVDAEVGASDEEMNHLVGLDRPLKDIVEDQEETNSEVGGRLDDLESLSQENADGVKANAEAIANQKIEDHADVEITDIKKNMVLKWDGTQWVADFTGEGGMIKPYPQPSTAGDFDVQEAIQAYRFRTQSNSPKKATLVVPEGAYFCLQGITAVPDSSNGQTVPNASIELGELKVDGVNLYPGSSDEVTWKEGADHMWPSEESQTPIVVRESLEITVDTNIIQPSYQWADFFVHGFFSEG